MGTELTTTLEERGPTNNSVGVSVSTSHTFVHGFAEFDLGDVSFPGQGTVRVKSKFPRIKPKYERPRVPYRDIEAICSKLMVYVAENVDIDGREEYFKKVVLNAVIWAAYTNPFLELNSIEMDFCFKYLVLLWIADDMFECAIKNKINFKLFKQVLDQFQLLFTEGHNCNLPERFEGIPSYPIFGQLFDALSHQLNGLWSKHMQQFGKRSKIFSESYLRYYAALSFSCIVDIDERHSVETFKAFRKDDSCTEAVIEFYVLAQGITLPENVRKSATMLRIVDLVKAIVAFTNDLLGIKKDLDEGTKENLLVFLITKKGIPLDLAVQEVCEIVWEAMVDYDLMKEIILKQFDNDENLIKYLDIFDSSIDGHYAMYVEATRYLEISSSVVLTR